MKTKPTSHLPHPPNATSPPPHSAAATRPRIHASPAITGSARRRPSPGPCAAGRPRIRAPPAIHGSARRRPPRFRPSPAVHGSARRHPTGLARVAYHPLPCSPPLLLHLALPPCCPHRPRLRTSVQSRRPRPFTGATRTRRLSGDRGREHAALLPARFSPTRLLTMKISSLMFELPIYFELN